MVLMMTTLLLRKTLMKVVRLVRMVMVVTLVSVVMLVMLVTLVRAVTSVKAVSMATMNIERMCSRFVQTKFIRRHLPCCVRSRSLD